MPAMNAPRPAGIPLRADRDALGHNVTKSLVRAGIAHMLAKNDLARRYPGDIAEQMWPHDSDAAWLTKAATSPATTTSIPSLLQTANADFLATLGPMSAGSVLLSRGVQLAFGQNAGVSIPRIVADATGVDFVAEAAPLPVRQLTVGSLILVPDKFGTISVYTGELFRHSIPNIEKLVRLTLTENVALALDSALLGTAASTADRPAGLRNAISALTPSAATPTDAAMNADIAAVVGAVAPVAGAAPIVLLAGPARATRLPRDRGLEVLASGAIASDELIAVATNALASATDPVPRIDVGAETLLHMETSPTAIGTTGSPNTVAAPARSLWQTDTVGLRLILQISWGLRHTSGLAWIDNITAW